MDTGLSHIPARSGKTLLDHITTPDASFLSLLTYQEEYEALRESLDYLQLVRG